MPNNESNNFVLHACSICQLNHSTVPLLKNSWCYIHWIASSCRFNPETRLKLCQNGEVQFSLVESSIVHVNDAMGSKASSCHGGRTAHDNISCKYWLKRIQLLCPIRYWSGMSPDAVIHYRGIYRNLFYHSIDQKKPLCVTWVRRLLWIAKCSHVIWLFYSLGWNKKKKLNFEERVTK